MGGRTSAASHNKYNAKVYDRVNLVVPKGQKEQIQEYAKEHGMSLNAYINNLIKADMGDKLKPGGVVENIESEPLTKDVSSCSISPSLKRAIKMSIQNAVQNYPEEEYDKLRYELDKLIYETFADESKKPKKLVKAADSAQKENSTKICHCDSLL
mgnify:FL=1